MDTMEYNIHYLNKILKIDIKKFSISNNIKYAWNTRSK